MTEGKESGLEELRTDFPLVNLPEPWTLGTLREELDKHPEIRRKHIDDVVGLDHEFARQMFERGAQLRTGWDEQSAAALEGPLAVLGKEEEVRAAQAAFDRECWQEASEGLEQVAAAIADRAPAVADVLLLQAARAAAEHGDRDRAGQLHLRVSRSGAARGDDVAEYAAFQASWELPETERWRSFAATARAAWPERPDEALPVLRDAFEHSLDRDDGDAIAEWADALCDAPAAEDDWHGVLDVASRAIARLGPLTDDGLRLDLELESLTARFELGEVVDNEFGMLLLSPLGHGDATAGRIYARWGVALSRRGQPIDAAVRFREAAQRWRAAGDSEDEVAEAIFSEDAMAQLTREGKRVDQTQRIAVAELRGRDQTAAVLADRKEHEALRTWLAGRAYDARRVFTIAWSIHRRAGHLGGCMRLAVDLTDLSTAAEEWPSALAWAARSGNIDRARTAALKLSWPEVRKTARPGRPSWERGPTWEAVAITGLLASDADGAALIDDLLEAASDHDTSSTQLPPEACAARRALSTILCATPEDRFAQAAAEVTFEIEHTPFPPDQAMQGLLFAIEAGLWNHIQLVAEVFAVYDRSHVGGFQTATHLIEQSDPAAVLLAERAASGFTALLTAAWCGSPDQRPELAQHAADVTERALTDALAPDEILRANDQGQLARWASADHQREVADTLIKTLADPSQIDVHRFEAGEGLAALAARMQPEAASSALDVLLAAADAIETPSELQGLRSHRNPRFARSTFNTPVTPGAVDSMALRAAVELAGRCERLDELQSATEAGSTGPQPRVRAEALRLSTRWTSLATADLRSFLTDEDEYVQAQALKCLGKVGSLAREDSAVTDFATPQQPLSLRAAALNVAREHPDRFTQALELLAEDPHAPVRATARNARRGHGQTESADDDEES